MDIYIKHFNTQQDALGNPNVISPATITVGELVLFGNFGKDTPCKIVPDDTDGVAIGVEATFDNTKFNKTYFQ